MHGEPSAIFVKHLKERCAKYFSTAGPAFLSKVINYFGGHEQAMREVCESVQYWVTAVSHQQGALTALQERVTSFCACEKCGNSCRRV